MERQRSTLSQNGSVAAYAATNGRQDEETLSLAEFGLLSASFATLLGTCVLGMLLPV